MTSEMHPVVVRQLPKTQNVKQVALFLRELEASMDAGRPRIVIDCSTIQSPDIRTLRALLCSLEEAMKRNGDVRLASLPKQFHSAMEESGIFRLFEVFETTEEAISSFQRPSHLPSGARENLAANTHHSAGNAA
jgi:anti-anti-sigma factor